MSRHRPDPRSGPCGTPSGPPWPGTASRRAIPRTPATARCRRPGPRSAPGYLPLPLLLVVGSAVRLAPPLSSTTTNRRIVFRQCAADEIDGASRARTGDLLAASQTLSQLSYGPVGRVSLASARCELDRRDVAPELLEPVEASRVRCEEVEDDVEVIGDDPARLGEAGDRPRQQAVVLLQRPSHLVVHRLRLAGIPPGSDHEEVRVVADAAHVEDRDVGRQLLL